MARIVEDYRSRIGTEEGIGSLQLGPQAYIDPRDQRYVHDAYQYFLNQQGGQTGLPGGTPAAPIAQDPTTMIPQTGGGTGITSASAVQPTSDPFLMSGAAGGARLPTMDQAGAIAAMTPNQAYAIPGQSDPFLASGAAGGARLPATQATTTLPSGDVFASDDPMLPEKMDYTPTAESQSAWQQVQSGLGNIGDFIKTHGQTAANFFMNTVQPGLGLAAKMLPSESPIDKFNREYALGGDLYENVVSQVDDPNFEGRLEGYAGDLIAGTGEGKDPFGINTVSQFGDYPAYATKTYNDIVAKEKAGKKLSQFDEDRKEYYGHISGLTGKTNIPGTPLMVGDPVYGDYDIDEDIITPKPKPKVDDVIVADTIAGNTVYGNAEIGFFPSRAEAQDALDALDAQTAKDDILPTDIVEGGDFEEIGGWEEAARLDAERKIREENERAALAKEAAMSGQRDIVPIDDTMPENLGLQPYESWMDYEDPIMGMVDEDLIDRGNPLGDERIVPEQEGLTADKQMAMNFERQQVAKREEMERAARAREEAAVGASLEAVQRAEAEQRARAREEAAQRDREEAANRAAAERAAAQATAAQAAADRMAEERGGRDEPAPAPTGIVRPGGGDPGMTYTAPAPTGIVRPGSGGSGGGGCFLKGTQVTMADGSTKAIEQVDLGDKVAKGGKVFATGKFLVDNLHDYKGIKVSGSHMVNEDGNWTRVEDSKHGKPLGDDEHTVYVFGAENRRILINNILFTDYFEVKEQEKLSEGDKFFDNWKLHAKVDSDNNVNVLNAS